VRMWIIADCLVGIVGRTLFDSLALHTWPPDPWPPPTIVAFCALYAFACPAGGGNFTKFNLNLGAGCPRQIGSNQL
jgi:hypothetical protein